MSPNLQSTCRCGALCACNPCWCEGGSAEAIVRCPCGAGCACEPGCACNG